MPTYDYICDSCKHEFEAFESIKADPQTLCPECKAPHPESPRLAAHYLLPGVELFRAVGCAACRGRGYRGRLAIHEVIPAEKFLPLVAEG